MKIGAFISLERHSTLSAAHDFAFDLFFFSFSSWSFVSELWLGTVCTSQFSIVWPFLFINHCWSPRPSSHWWNGWTRKRDRGSGNSNENDKVHFFEGWHQQRKIMWTRVCCSKDIRCHRVPFYQSSLLEVLIIYLFFSIEKINFSFPPFSVRLNYDFQISTEWNDRCSLSPILSNAHRWWDFISNIA